MSSKEYCFGCKVSSDEPEYVWDPEGNLLDDDETSASDKGFVYSLILKHAVLDSGCPVGEQNVVELETNNFFSQIIKQPVVNLINGRKEQCHVDILLTEPMAKLTLIKGSGPVYIWGQLIIELEDGEEDEDDEHSFHPTSHTGSVAEEDEDEREGEEVDEDEIEDIIKDAGKNKQEEISTRNKVENTATNGKEDVATKKRKKSEPKPVWKKPKLSASGNGNKKDDDESDEEEDDKNEDDDDDDSEEETEKHEKENVKTPKAKSPPASAKKSSKKKRQQKNKGR